jgi:hypothetical protein
MAVQPFVVPWPLIQFRNLFYTDGRTPWTGDQPVARPLPTYRTTQTQNKRTHSYPCLEWNSNPRFQRPSERRQFILQTARPPWLATCLIFRRVCGNIHETNGKFHVRRCANQASLQINMAENRNYTTILIESLHPYQILRKSVQRYSHWHYVRNRTST